MYSINILIIRALVRFDNPCTHSIPICFAYVMLSIPGSSNQLPILHRLCCTLNQSANQITLQSSQDQRHVTNARQNTTERQKLRPQIRNALGFNVTVRSVNEQTKNEKKSRQTRSSGGRNEKSGRKSPTSRAPTRFFRGLNSR